MRVHLASMGAERAVSVCYETMPPDAGRVTAAARARAARPREPPPRFEPLTFGLRAQGRRSGHRSTGPARRRGAVVRGPLGRPFGLLDLSGGAPPFQRSGGLPSLLAFRPVLMPRTPSDSESLIAFVAQERVTKTGMGPGCGKSGFGHAFIASQLSRARTHKLSLCRQG